MPDPDGVPTITIDMDTRCTRCRKRGATPCGLCLGCAAKLLEKEDLTMARATKATAHAQHAAEQA